MLRSKEEAISTMCATTPEFAYTRTRNSRLSPALFDAELLLIRACQSVFESGGTFVLRFAFDKGGSVVVIV